MCSLLPSKSLYIVGIVRSQPKEQEKMNLWLKKGRTMAPLLPQGIYSLLGLAAALTGMESLHRSWSHVLCTAQTVL